MHGLALRCLLVYNSHSGFICVHDGLLAPLCIDCSLAALLSRVSGSGSSAMGGSDILFHAPATTYCMSDKRLCLEVVSHRPIFINVLVTFVFSYRRTYLPASYHIAQELQKYNIPDYRPRQEQ